MKRQPTLLSQKDVEEMAGEKVLMNVRVGLDDNIALADFTNELVIGEGSMGKVFLAYLNND